MSALSACQTTENNSLLENSKILSHFATNSWKILNSNPFLKLLAELLCVQLGRLLCALTSLHVDDRPRTLILKGTLAERASPRKTDSVVQRLQRTKSEQFVFRTSL